MLCYGFILFQCSPNYIYHTHVGPESSAGPKDTFLSKSKGFSLWQAYFFNMKVVHCRTNKYVTTV